MRWFFGRLRKRREALEVMRKTTLYGADVMEVFADGYDGEEALNRIKMLTEIYILDAEETELVYDET